MNLADMASYVCSKVNQTETDDVAACKTFLRRRYESVLNDQLWKDSLAMVSVSVDPANADNAAGVVVLPELIDRPIAVRGPNNSVVVNPLERYFRIDLDMFLRTGTAFEMALLSPAWLTVRPDTSLWVDVTSSLATNDGVLWTLAISAGQIFRITNSGTSAFTVHDLLFTVNTLCNPGDTIIVSGAVDTPLKFTWTDFSHAIFLGTVERLSASTLPTNTSTGPNTSSNNPNTTVTIASSDAGDTNKIKIIWRDQAGKRYEQTGALPQTLTPDDDAGYFEIEAIFKPTTTGTVTVTLNDTSGLTSTLGTLAPTDTRTPAYQRIRIFDMPAADASAVVLRVAGKVKCDQLDFDNQEPVLRDCENILLAFAQGDMLERERRYGQAQAMFAEAVAHLEQYKKRETVQQAYNKRIIPQFGYGGDWQLYSTNDLLTF